MPVRGGSIVFDQKILKFWRTNWTSLFSPKEPLSTNRGSTKPRNINTGDMIQTVSPSTSPLSASSPSPLHKYGRTRGEEMLYETSSVNRGLLLEDRFCLETKRTLFLQGVPCRKRCVMLKSLAGSLGWFVTIGWVAKTRKFRGRRTHLVSSSAVHKGARLEWRWWERKDFHWMHAHCKCSVTSKCLKHPNIDHTSLLERQRLS
jgi:hypothetical protein